MYFILFSNCIITEGFKNAIIVDTHKNSYTIISKKLIYLINELKQKDLRQIQNENPEDVYIKLYNFLLTLVNDNLGFFTRTPQCFPELNLQWHYNSIITNSIISVDKLSINKLSKILLELDLINCKDIQIRVTEDISFDELNIQLTNICNSKIKNIEIFLPFSLKNYLKKLISKHYRITRILVYNSPYNKNEENIAYIKASNINEIHCGCISSKNFTANIKFYSESQCHNNCLNRKVSIDEKGNIKNCPNMQHHFGNIFETNLIDVVRNQEFRKLWYYKKDDIDVCQDCEFRYICTDCRAFIKNPNNLLSQPTNCDYNPYISLWKGQKNWISVKQWRKENSDWKKNISQKNIKNKNCKKNLKEEIEYFDNL